MRNLILLIVTILCLTSCNKWNGTCQGISDDTNYYNYLIQDYYSYLANPTESHTHVGFHTGVEMINSMGTLFSEQQVLNRIELAEQQIGNLEHQWEHNNCD